MNSLARKTSVVVVIALTISGCATTEVASKKELFGESVDKKQCYVFDTMGRDNARNMPTTVTLGILGGLFPPLALITAAGAGASAAADAESLPSKCGLVFDDAVLQTTETSFYEKATATFRAKSGNIWGQVRHISDVDEDCSMHEAKFFRETAQGIKLMSQQITVCRNDDGVPVVKPIAG